MQDLLPWLEPWGVWTLYGFMAFAGGVLVLHGLPSLLLWDGKRFTRQQVLNLHWRASGR